MAISEIKAAQEIKKAEQQKIEKQKAEKKKKEEIKKAESKLKTSCDILSHREKIGITENKFEKLDVIRNAEALKKAIRQ